MRKPPQGRPFQKGRSGNPGGRPKKEVSITALVKDALMKSELCGRPVPGGTTAAVALAEAMVLRAIEGEAPYMREVVQRVDGVLAPTNPADENKLDLAAILSMSDERERRLEDAEDRGVDTFHLDSVMRQLGPDWRRKLGVIDAPRKPEQIIDVTPNSKSLPKPGDQQ